VLFSDLSSLRDKWLLAGVDDSTYVLFSKECGARRPQT
jgi:hypothetical protein